MRFLFNKELEFFFKKYFLSEKYLLKRRLERSIRNEDEKEIKLIKDLIKPNTDSLDIGVYRGVYSYEMAKYSNIVHSFEPNPVIFKFINKNLKEIKKNIILYNCALSNKNKTMDLKIPIRNSKYDKNNFEEYYQMGKATIHTENEFLNYEKFEVNTKIIDDIDFLNEVSFIKIDVEGHEKEVIEGGIDTIKKNKPKLLVEIEEQYTKKSVQETINYINSIGYNSFVYADENLKNTSDINDLNMYNNFVFFPK